VRILDFENSKQLIRNFESKIIINDKLLSHNLEYISNGIFELNFVPFTHGTYFITFMNNGQIIQGNAN
jgi:hypothetical protein